jgi:hypothetical protein
MSKLAKVCTALALLNLVGFVVFLTRAPSADEYIKIKEAELESGSSLVLIAEPFLIGGRAVDVHEGWSPAFAYFLANLPALMVADYAADFELWLRFAPSSGLIRWNSLVVGWIFVAALLLQWLSPLLVRAVVRLLRRSRQLPSSSQLA